MSSDLLKTLNTLASERLVNLRFNDDHSLVIAKYSKRAFWDSTSWARHPELIQARGQVFEAETGVVVAMPFAKIFNYGENNAGDCLKDSDEVMVVEKINGFLAISFWYNGKNYVTSSGTFDSEYADKARHHLPEQMMENLRQCASKEVDICGYERINFMFEICDIEDKHVIGEHIGAYLIGAKVLFYKDHWVDVSECSLDRIWLRYQEEFADGPKLIRPSTTLNVSFGWLKSHVNDPRACQIEGYMVYPKISTGVGPFKMKSQFYLIQKFLSRTKKDLAQWWATGKLTESQAENYDEELQKLVSHFNKLYTWEAWLALDEGEKISLMTTFLENESYV